MPRTCSLIEASAIQAFGRGRDFVFAQEIWCLREERAIDAFMALSLPLAADIAVSDRKRARHHPEVLMNEPSRQIRYRDGMRMVLGAALALGLWPWAVGCGATTRTDNDGTSAHAGANNAAGTSGGFGAAGALASGGSGDSEAASGHAEQGGRSFGGQSSGGGGTSLGGAAGGGGATSSSSGRAGGGEAGTGGNPISCVGPMAHFPEFDRSCSTASDCRLVTHTTSCCGSRLAIAIAASEMPAFNSAEAICDAQYPACGCAAQGVQVEDGTHVGESWQAEVKAACDSGRCRAHYAGTTFSCGANTCTDKQYCSMSSGGPAGTAPSANCEQTTCTDCACLKVDSPACSCSVSNGHLVVSCQRA